MAQTMAVGPGDRLAPDLKELQLAIEQDGKPKDTEVFDEDSESDDSDIEVEQHGHKPTSGKRKAQNAAMRGKIYGIENEQKHPCLHVVFSQHSPPGSARR